MKTRILLLLGLVFVFSYGCNEDDLTQLDPNRVVPESFFETEGQLESTVISGYATLRSQMMTGRAYFFIHDLMDDHHVGTSALQIEPGLVRGQQTATAVWIGNLFDAYYDMVHRMNTALDGIALNTTVDENTKRNLEAEAKFLRGWAYNEIATLWGGAPIYLTRSLSTADYAGRSSREEVLSQAQSDLKFAADNLPADRSDATRGRATKGAAFAFLGRSLLQSDKLTEARAALQSVVDLEKYSLLENFGDNFTEENEFTAESIFEVIYAPFGDYNWDDSGDSSWGGTNAKSVRAQEYGPSWRNVTPTSSMLNAFANTENGDSYTDPRMGETVIFEGDSYAGGTAMLEINYNGPAVMYDGQEVYVNWYKYGVYYKEVPGGYRTTTTNFILMRYADVLLMLAETEARGGDLQNARDLVNEVRARVGIPSLDDAGILNGTPGEVVAAIVKERAAELASEQVRARDLRRWHRAGVINAADYLDYFSDKQLVLPIPQNEIINNPMISQQDQNPGYN